MTPEMQDLLTSATHARPELLLALFALVFVVVGAWFGERSFLIVSALGVLALLGAGVLAIYDKPSAQVEIFRGELSVDGFAVFAKALIGFSAAANLALPRRSSGCGPGSFRAPAFRCGGPRPR